jgi:hypothetical protein
VRGRADIETSSLEKLILPIPLATIIEPDDGALER